MTKEQTTIKQGIYIIVSRDIDVQNFLFIDVKSFVAHARLEGNGITDKDLQKFAFSISTARYPMDMLKRVAHQKCITKNELIVLESNVDELDIDFNITDSRVGTFGVTKELFNSIGEKEIVLTWKGVSKVNNKEELKSLKNILEENQTEENIETRRPNKIYDNDHGMEL